MQDLTQIVDRVQTAWPGAPASVVLREVVAATQEWLRDTRYWRARIDLPLEKDKHTYDYSAQLGEVHEAARIGHVIRVLQDGREVAPTDPDHIDRVRPDWDTWKGNVAEHYFLLDASTSLRVVPIPNLTEPKPLLLSVGLTIARGATKIPDDAWQDGVDGIVAGARGRLLLERATHLSAEDPLNANRLQQQAAAQMMIFNTNVGRAKRRGERSQTTQAKRRVRMHVF